MGKVNWDTSRSCVQGAHQHQGRGVQQPGPVQQPELFNNTRVRRELIRIKDELFHNPDMALDDRIKKLRQINYKNDYKLRKVGEGGVR